MAKNENVEEVIRMPAELPNGWQTAALADVAEIVMGQSPSSSYYNTDGKGLPFFQGKAEFGDLYPEAVKWCTKPNKVAQKEDVLISVRAPVGPTNLAPSECCIGRGLAAIRPKDSIPSKYLLYYLRSIESDIEALGTGTTFKAIAGKVLRSIPIPVAPPDQQQRIVAEIEKQFSRLDEAVASLKRAQANLKRYKASVLKAAVEGKLTEQWRKEHTDVEPASDLLKRIIAERQAKWKGRGKYKEPAALDTTNLLELPHGWVWTTLSVIAELKGGITKGQKRKPTDKLRMVPYLRVANVQRGFIDLTEVKEIEATEEEIAELALRKGDILFNEGGDRDKLGRGWVWDGQIKECIHQNHVFRARLNSPDIEPEFVSWHGNSFGQQYFFDEGKHTTNLASINMTKLSGLPVPLPSAAEQKQIVAEVERRLSMVEELEAEVTTNRQRAERLRQVILRKAFSGKLGLIDESRKGKT
jgi:type I restriction enzyme, S subunit